MNQLDKERQLLQKIMQKAYEKGTNGASLEEVLNQLKSDLPQFIKLHK